MALSVAELKDLIAFGRENGLQRLEVEGLSVTFGSPPSKEDEKRASDAPDSPLPEELRHYSAAGRAAFGKR